MTSDKRKIIFLGTPEFAVPSLDALIKNQYDIAAVITAPEKPAGRGMKPHPSPVKRYADEHNLFVLQPDNLKDPGFISEVRSFSPDLMIVVAFRMMPEILWKMPRLGTINLHASLLPQYRGAAPIQRAVMNGETESGITTFFLRHQIDTGDVLFREPITIGENETSGELHDRMKTAGAALVVKTVEAIFSGDFRKTKQSSLSSRALLHTAPKITKEDCRIDWKKPAVEIHNLVRGLSPVPGAFTSLISPQGNYFMIKIMRSEKYLLESTVEPGSVSSDSKNFFRISTGGGWLEIKELQLSGKRIMETEEFLRGFRLDNGWKAS